MLMHISYANFFRFPALIQYFAQEALLLYKSDHGVFIYFHVGNAQHPVTILEVYIAGAYVKVSLYGGDHVLPVFMSCYIGPEYTYHSIRFGLFKNGVHSYIFKQYIISPFLPRSPRQSVAGSGLSAFLFLRASWRPCAGASVPSSVVSSPSHRHDGAHAIQTAACTVTAIPAPARR